MHIYFTGSTALQADKVKKPRIQKLNVPKGIVAQLRAAGHDVTWDVLHPGDDWPHQPELVWVNISSPCTVNSPFALHATWAIYKAISENIPLVVFFDDWQFKTMFSAYRTFVKLGERQLLKTMGGTSLYPPADIARAIEVLPQLQMAGQWMNDGLPGALGVIPKYSGWGDPQLAVAKMPNNPTIAELDPTSLIELPEVTERYKNKEREWLLASLMPHVNWLEKQHLQWPVNFVGSMKMKAPRLKTEQDVVIENSKYWGTLCPTYPHAGSGWFRTRFVYAAYAGSVLFCGPDDAAALGSPYQISSQYIEALDRQELDDLANEQFDFLYQRTSFDPQVMANQLDHIIATADALASTYV